MGLHAALRHGACAQVEPTMDVADVGRAVVFMASCTTPRAHLLPPPRPTAHSHLNRSIYYHAATAMAHDSDLLCPVLRGYVD